MRLPQKADLIPWIARIISSPTTRRYRQTAFRWQARAKAKQDVIDVFINPRDPFSSLLLQALPDLLKRFHIQLRFQTIWQQPENMFPEPDLWKEWAIRDAARLADLYGLEGPEPHAKPTDEKMASCRDYLLSLEHSDDYLAEATTALTALWQESHSSAAGKAGSRSPELEHRLQKNEQQLQALGHYQGSMLFFRGEWFWGVDRLDHLERLLIDEGRGQHPGEQPVYDRTWADLGKRATTLPDKHPARDNPLEVFFSVRSPYSYLGLERAIQLAEAWNLPLRLRPVLPMLMRGRPVPNAKKWYIFQDTKREATKFGIPYGFVADPLGSGVERCYALFDYARSLGREVEYMRTYARAVNAEGLRSETDKGLKIIVERAGLDWPTAKALLTDQSWREWAEDNRKEMYNCGLWGVPSFRYGAVSCWGQDRLWVIEEAIKKEWRQAPLKGSATRPTMQQSPKLEATGKTIDSNKLPSNLLTRKVTNCYNHWRAILNLFRKTSPS